MATWAIEFHYLLDFDLLAIDKTLYKREIRHDKIENRKFIWNVLSI